MKKMLSLICILLVCACLLAACGARSKGETIDMSTPPTSAEQAMAYMDASMQALQSYRMDMTMKLQLYAQGERVRSESTCIMIEDAGQIKNDYYSYTEVRNSLYFGNGMTPNYKVTSIDAYHNGVAYQSYYQSQNKKSRKISAKMRPDEFIAYMERNVDMGSFDYADCESMSLEQTDKGYVITCSGYSAQAMRAVADSTGISDVHDDAFSEVQAVIMLGKDYLPTKITLDVTVDTQKNYQDLPYFRIEIRFSEFNAAERIVASISPEDYTMIKNFDLLTEMDDLIAKSLDRKEGSFTREVTHTLTYSGSTDTSSQVDVTASFINDKKEGFSFKAEIEEGDIVPTKVTYNNGDLIGLRAPNGSKINRMSDDEAKAELLTLVNDPLFGYDVTRVLNIEKTKTGYLVTLIPSPYSVVEQLDDSLGVNLTGEPETIEFVVKWGKLVKIVHSFEGRGKFSGEELVYKGSITVTFE